ncbi:MAG: lytic transglycosylase domain-containing protein [Pseudolysinimonas sp.]
MRGSLSVFAAFACTVLVGVSLASPHASSQAEVLAPAAHLKTQSYAAGIDTVDAVTRDGFKVTKLVTPKPVRRAPAAGIPDPGTAQAIALEMLTARGWDSSQFDCLVALWNRESHWNVYSHNTGSGAYGIPQALPGEKMASAGADWATNPATQITWGLGYIAGRYGTPCGAWNHSQATGWY